MAKILTNTTTSDVFVTDTGTTIPASSTYTIPPQYYAMWVNSANIVTLINAGTITVANSLRTLPTTALMIKELSTIEGLAEDIPFDNSTDGFAATQVQAAIEEAKSKSRFTITMASYGGLGINSYINYGNSASNNQPFIALEGCTLIGVTYSSASTLAINLTLSFVKNGTTFYTTGNIGGVTSGVITGLSQTFASGDKLGAFVGGVSLGNTIAVTFFFKVN